MLRCQLCPPPPGVLLSVCEASRLLNRSHSGLPSWGPPAPAASAWPSGGSQMALVRHFGTSFPPKRVPCEGVSKACPCVLPVRQCAGSATRLEVRRLGVLSSAVMPGTGTSVAVLRPNRLAEGQGGWAACGQPSQTWCRPESWGDPVAQQLGSVLIPERGTSLQGRVWSGSEPRGDPLTSDRPSVSAAGASGRGWGTRSPAVPLSAGSPAQKLAGSPRLSALQFSFLTRVLIRGCPQLEVPRR